MEQITSEDAWIMNEQRTRAAVVRPYGIALYAMSGDTGTHVGIVEDEMTAEAWVDGREVERIVRIYGPA